MKLALNSRLYTGPRTGIPIYIEGLYRQLSKTPNLSVVYFQTNQSKTLGKTIVSNLPAPIFDLLAVHWLIICERPDIFHGPAHILPIFKRKGTKYVLTIHDLSFLVQPQNDSWLFRIYYKYAVGWSLKRADCILADSKSTKHDIVKLYHQPADKISVVYPGLREEFINSKPRPPVVTGKYFLAVATHPKRKNIYRVIEAFASSPKLNEYTLALAGELSPQSQEEILSLASQLKVAERVKVLGYVTTDALIALYQHAVGFVYPSLYEGFGMPILEAMSCGCPVIAGDNSSMVELVNDRAWLADALDPKDIETKMLKLVGLSAGQRKQLINNNLSFSQKFSWSQAKAAFLSNLEKK